MRSASEASNFRCVILNHKRKVKIDSVKTQSTMAVVASVVPLYSIRAITAYAHSMCGNGLLYRKGIQGI
jgi:hypothetical protein